MNTQQTTLHQAFTETVLVDPQPGLHPCTEQMTIYSK